MQSTYQDLKKCFLLLWNWIKENHRSSFKEKWLNIKHRHFKKMCKVALCCFFSLNPQQVFSRPLYAVSYSFNNTTTKVFAHINEQILQIAVAGSCMCVCVLFRLKAIQNNSNIINEPYVMWCRDDNLRTLASKSNLYMLCLGFFFFRKIRNVYYCLESPSATCGIYQETVWF